MSSFSSSSSSSLVHQYSLCCICRICMWILPINQDRKVIVLNRCAVEVDNPVSIYEEEALDMRSFFSFSSGTCWCWFLVRVFNF